jgi:hypothetical protein
LYICYQATFGDTLFPELGKLARTAIFIVVGGLGGYGGYELWGIAMSKNENVYNDILQGSPEPIVYA